jgi:hypothetical protein
MGAGVQVLTGINIYTTGISLNEGPAKNAEAGTIEDENQEHRKNNLCLLLSTLNYNRKISFCYVLLQCIFHFGSSSIGCDIKF